MAIEPVNSINSNVAAGQTARILGESSFTLQRSLLRASSGLRISSPEVDPAALAQFIQLEAQLGRIGATEVNVSNAVSFTQTQEGFLQGVGAALNRMGELSIQAQDVTKSPQDLANIQQEFSQLQSFVGDVSNQKFNGVALFAGANMPVTSDSEGGTVTLEGINLGAAGSAGGLGDVMSGISVSNPAAAAAASTTINNAVQNLASMRGTLGANLGQLSLSLEGNSVLEENLAAARSRIGDTNLASESTQLARMKLLIQAGTANLGKANQLPASTLQLLA